MALHKDWIAKAEGDYKSAVALNRLRKEPQPDNVCYHCQQSAEKYLKAFLVQNGFLPPRTHNLHDLLRDCAAIDTSLSICQPDIAVLNPYSVLYRYPGIDATKAEALTAISSIRDVRRHLRKSMGL